MKKVSIFLLGVIGIILIVYFSKDHEDYTANSYIQEEVVNDDLGQSNNKVNSEKMSTTIKVKKMRNIKNMILSHIDYPTEKSGIEMDNKNISILHTMFLMNN